jgi:hypothetical protein
MKPLSQKPVRDSWISTYRQEDPHHILRLLVIFPPEEGTPRGVSPDRCAEDVVHYGRIDLALEGGSEGNRGDRGNMKP